ncbi:nucleobindin-1-like [Tropilaelaps mercedesae]|uniref:Nucleobindin-1-like n=1 Tax=Tropilaelaps mercedesae TaxID=418985 RepID=A0A1V9XFR1_9ACAR|nr:nucleobindin-1-like [Tropilaelaps mercedesae]
MATSLRLNMSSDRRAPRHEWAFCFVLVAWALLGTTVCPPVDPNNKDAGAQDPGPPHDVNNETDPAFIFFSSDLTKQTAALQRLNQKIMNLEYGRYLAEVVKILETDKEFAKKLENISQDDIRNGHVATHLDLVDHKVRTKLDELKRIEVDRLRKLTQKKNELEHGIDRGNVINDHLDSGNQHTFEIEDLKKLILAATRDLEKLDEARKAEFKQYEMEKEFEFQQGLKNMTAEQKKIEEKKHEEGKHRKHPQAHHPGSKAQLEQVWEEEDHMDKQDFDPKTFFAMHDLNNDGVLDEQEVEAILQLEAKKMYMSDPQNPGDPREMEEEINRMREHVFKEVDNDKDGLISRKEFLHMAQNQEFERDNGWKGLDEQQIYSQEELQRFMQMREQQMMQMAQQGYGYHPGAPPNMQYHPGYGNGLQGPPPGFQQQPGMPPMAYHPQGQPNGYIPQGVPQGVPQNHAVIGQQQVYQQPAGYVRPPPALPPGGHQGINPQIPAAPQLNSNNNQYQQISLQQQGLSAPKVIAGLGPPSPTHPNQAQNNFNQLPSQPQQFNQQGSQQFNAQSSQQQFVPQQQQRQQQFVSQQQQQQQQQQPQYNGQPQQLNQPVPPQPKLQQPPSQEQAQFKPINSLVGNQPSIRA